MSKRTIAIRNSVGPLIKVTPMGNRAHDAARVANIEFAYK